MLIIEIRVIINYINNKYYLEFENTYLNDYDNLSVNCPRFKNYTN